MPWTTTTWTDADWALLVNINEFMLAVWERDVASDALPPDPFVPAAIGDDVQSVAFWGTTIQSGLAVLGVDFVVSHDAGVMRAAGYYHDKASQITYPSFETYGTLAAIFAAAGLAYSDWRRYTVHPDDGGTVQYGGMQQGDIIGPWIFEDIQKICSVLQWTVRQGYNENWDLREGSGSGADWATAKTAAEADYDAYTPISTGPGHDWECRSEGWDGYTAYLGSRVGYFDVENLGSLSKNVELYALAEKRESTYPFDANGHSVIEDKWSLLDTVATSGADTTFGPYGDITPGNYPVWCAQPPGSGSSGRGFDVPRGNVWAVVRWGFSDL